MFLGLLSAVIYSSISSSVSHLVKVLPSITSDIKNGQACLDIAAFQKPEIGAKVKGQSVVIFSC